MNQKSDVKVTVVSIAKPCGSGMQVGDTFYCERKDGLGLRLRQMDGWCPELVLAAQTALSAMAFGGTLPWEDEQGRALSACPDPECRVVIAVERVKES